MRPKLASRQPTFRIAWKHIAVLVLAVISVGAALALLILPDKIQLAMILAVPGLVFLLIVLLNPYVGICIYLIFEFMRPYDLFPVLLPLKVPMLVIGTTGLAWLIRVSRAGGIRMYRFTWVYLAFVALIGFTVVTAGNYYFALQTFKAMIIYVIIFFASLDFVNSYKRLNRIVWLMLLIHLYLALKGTLNYLGGQYVFGNQVTSGAVGTSFLADENDYALALNVMIPFAFFAVTYSHKLLAKLASFGILISLMFGVVSSFSRGGWLGLVAAIGYCLLRSKRKAVTISFAIVLIITLAIAAPSSYWNEIATISDTHQATAETRFHYWKAAVRMYLDYPLIGVGASNGGPHLPDYMTGIAHPEREWGRAFHGTFPQVLAELGTVGIVLYLSLLIMAFRNLSRARRSALHDSEDTMTIQFSDSIIGAMLAYLVSATFLSTAYYPQLWTLLTFSMVVYKLNSERLEHFREESEAASAQLALTRTGDS